MASNMYIKNKFKSNIIGGEGGLQSCIMPDSNDQQFPLTQNSNNAINISNME